MQQHHQHNSESKDPKSRITASQPHWPRSTRGFWNCEYHIGGNLPKAGARCLIAPFQHSPPSPLILPSVAKPSIALHSPHTIASLTQPSESCIRPTHVPSSKQPEPPPALPCARAPDWLHISPLDLGRRPACTCFRGWIDAPSCTRDRKRVRGRDGGMKSASQWYELRDMQR